MRILLILLQLIISFSLKLNYEDIKNDKTVITLEKAFLDEKCQPLQKENDLDFLIFYEREGNYTSDLKPFNVDLQHQQKAVSYPCECKSTFGKYLMCTLRQNMTVEGRYNIKFSGVVEEQYVIKEFESNNSLNFGENYIKPTTTFFVFVQDYHESKEGEMVFTFEDSIEEMKKPKVIVNSIELTCDVFDDELSCPFTKSQFPPDKETRNHTYLGVLINNCNMKDADIVLDVYENQYPTEIIVTKLLVDQKCNVYKKGYMFKLQFDEYPLVHEGPYIIDFVELMKNETYFIDVDCNHLRGNDYFQCTVNEDNMISGNYRPNMDMDIIDDDYIIRRFTLDDQVGFNPSHAEPKVNNLTVTHDYSISPICNFNVEFKAELNENVLPIITVHDKKLKCKRNDDNFYLLSCEFSQDDFPFYRKHGEYETYYGYMDNVCGTVQMYVRLEVTGDDFKKTNITFTKTEFSKTCQEYRKNVVFTLYFEREGIYHGSIEIPEIKLLHKNKENVLSANCTSKDKNNFATCFALDDPEVTLDGDYFVNFQNIYQTGIYNVLPYNSTETIKFTNPPLDKFINKYHNFAEGKEGLINVNFKFQFDQLAKIPTVEFDNNVTLSCKGSSNVVSCNFNDEQFPPIKGSENYTYYGHVVDICGDKAANIDLIVNKK